MIITRKAIPRRTLLRGIGAALALPMLDGMVPAFASLLGAAAAPVRRFGVVYVPNGMTMPNWTPATEGAGFELPPIMQPLARHRERLLVLSGLTSKPPAAIPGGGNHARASTRFLTDVPPKLTQNTELQAGTSMDQIAARQIGRDTQLTSLELSLDTRDFAGSCDVGFSCAYTNTIAWRSPTTPLPVENDPRAVFERMFGDSGTTDPALRRARLLEERSILDAVTEQIGRLQKGLDARDRAKIGQYLDAIRDVERRIQKAEEQSATELTRVDQPAGVPASFEEYAKLMFDLQVLAYQCDLTRVITFMMGRELTGRPYPEIGVPDAHHPTSHHQNDPVKLAKLTKINTFHASLFGYYLDKLQATPDGDASLLDHMILMYGAGMSDSQLHAHSNLPVMLVGGSGQLKGGRHIKYPTDTPLANLHLTLLDRLGVPIDSIGDSTTPLGL
jgi:Protein of unknown function (DUF1552)